MTTTTENEMAEIVMQIAAAQANGVATFKRLYSEIPNRVLLSQSDLAPSLTRNGEPMWHQIVRNIQSHHDTEGNAIYEGYLEHVPRVGYRITEYGRAKMA